MQKLQSIFGDRYNLCRFLAPVRRSDGVTFLFAASHARPFGKYGGVVTENRDGRERIFFKKKCEKKQEG